jgi:hypothetical protein
LVDRNRFTYKISQREPTKKIKFNLSSCLLLNPISGTDYPLSNAQRNHEKKFADKERKLCTLGICRLNYFMAQRLECKPSLNEAIAVSI